jgi:hypothetical protein
VLYSLWCVTSLVHLAWPSVLSRIRLTVRRRGAKSKVWDVYERQGDSLHVLLAHLLLAPPPFPSPLPFPLNPVLTFNPRRPCALHMLANVNPFRTTLPAFSMPYFRVLAAHVLGAFLFLFHFCLSLYCGKCWKTCKPTRTGYIPRPARTYIRKPGTFS